MPNFIYTSFVVFCCLSLSGCAGALLLGEEAIAVRAGTAMASEAAVLGTRTAIRRAGASAFVKGGVTADAVLLRGIAAGTVAKVSQLELLNVTATLRRGTRLGLTSAVIEEHCMIRAGSRLSVLAEESTYGRNSPLKLMSPQGNLIASASRTKNSVIIRNGKGGVISESRVEGNRVQHTFPDGSGKTVYGYSEIDSQKGLLKHYLLDAEGKGVLVGQDRILEKPDAGLKSTFDLLSGFLEKLEQSYPRELLPKNMEPFDQRLEMPLVTALPPRNEQFTVKAGTWSKGGLTYKLVGFTINEGMVATAQIQVSNPGKSNQRIGIDAVGNQGFQALPTIGATLEDSSGITLPCSSAKGAYWRSGYVGLWDARKVMGDQNGGYETLGVERWIGEMNEVSAGKTHVVTLKFTLDREESGSKNLDLNFLLRAAFYTTTENGGKYGKISRSDAIFEGIVPVK